MKKNNFVKKILAAIVIFLFIGIAVAPGITATIPKESSDNDYIELTTETCGIKGFGNHIVKLTKQEYQDLQQYLVDFRGRLNTTTTREETVTLYKEVVVELNKYGLLPQGMNVEQALKLTTVGPQNQRTMNLLNKISQRNHLTFNNKSNYLCFIAGNANQTLSLGIPCTALLIVARMTMFVGALCEVLELQLFVHVIEQVLFRLTILAGILFGINMKINAPVRGWSLLVFGNAYLGDVPEHYPSEGWIWSLGLNGIKKWDGKFIGDASNVLFSGGMYSLKYDIGAIGFTGLRISFSEQQRVFTFGTAWKVGFDES